MNKISRALFVLIVSCLNFGCGPAEKQALPPGQCYYNVDCAQGQRCADGYCEDIYYPDWKLKSGY